jgi:hypothetical protein
MPDPPFVATIEVDASVDAPTFDTAVDKAQRLGDNRSRVSDSTITAIKQDAGDFSATAMLTVDLHETSIDGAVTEAGEYCRTELDAYDYTLLKVERNQ